MTSSIGQGAWGNPKNAFIEFPREIMQGSTSGIGGHSSESHGRYPAGPSHEFIYKPGSYRFWKMHRGNYIAGKGTWGQTKLTKFNPVKQIGGSSGYLNQKPGIKRSSDFKVIVNTGRRATDPFLPRGGNVMRVVGTDNTENPMSFTMGYNESFGGRGQPGVMNNNPGVRPGGGPGDPVGGCGGGPGGGGPGNVSPGGVASPFITPINNRITYPDLDVEELTGVRQGADMSRRNAQAIQAGARTLPVSDQPAIEAPNESLLEGVSLFLLVYV